MCLREACVMGAIIEVALLLLSNIPSSMSMMRPIQGLKPPIVLTHSQEALFLLRNAFLADYVSGACCQEHNGRRSSSVFQMWQVRSR